MLPTLAKGLGPAGVKRFPYINLVLSTVRNKRETFPRNISDFDLVAAITQTVLNQGTANEIGPASSKERVHSHSMPLHQVVEALHQRNRAWQSICTSRIRSLLESYGRVALGTVSLVQADQPGKGSDSDSGLTVTQTIDAYSTAKRLRREAINLAQLKFLPTFDHVASLTLAGLSHSQHMDLNAGIADMTRYWQPSAQNADEVSDLISRVEALARVASQGRFVTARLFGSRKYGLCSDQSDVDITLSLHSPRGSGRMREADNRHFFRDLAAKLRKAAGFTRVIDVSHAYVPIIKFVYLTRDKNRLEGDISLNGGKGLAKSRLLLAYLGMDSRVRQVLSVVKMWAIRRDIINHNTLNSFGLLMMAIAFLISRKVIPPLQMLTTAQITPQAWERLARIHHCPHKIAMLYPATSSASAPTTPENARFAASSAVRCLQSGAGLPEWTIDGTRAYYFNGGDLHRWRSLNRDSPATLLFDMFRYYGFEFNPQLHAISPRLGSTTIPRTSLYQLPPLDSELTIDEPNKWRHSVRLLAIEDPFDLAVNCGRNAPPEWVEGLLWEMRRAAWALLPLDRPQGGGLHSPLDRLLLPPTENIYCDPGIWASAYHRALQSSGSAVSLFDPAVDCVPDRTVDLESLENTQLAGSRIRPPKPVTQPGQMRQTF
ncbi:hypothetical protein IW152_004398 [Coemansia sp. BCRC 34962]|nr:hypothetical protein IW152_004398 [Coemansia sp. BCRC 34962]